jgi:hypothetical protein
MMASTGCAADQISVAIEHRGIERDPAAFQHARRDRAGGLRDRIAEPDPSACACPKASAAVLAAMIWARKAALPPAVWARPASAARSTSPRWE